LEQLLGYERGQVIENMVARDGIEPPTPAFSGLDIGQTSDEQEMNSD
jgi:hypothetical protein